MRPNFWRTTISIGRDKESKPGWLAGLFAEKNISDFRFRNAKNLLRLDKEHRIKES